METGEPPDETTILRIENLYCDMADEAAATKRLEQRLEKIITEAAFAEFPALKNMSAEDFRKFDDRRNRAASNFALEVAEFAGRTEQE